MIRAQGVNVRENKYIGLGAHQSVEIRGQKQVTLIKRQFDSQHVRRLKEAAAEGKGGQILAIVMEEGIAHIFIVSGQTSKLKAKIEKHISKRKAFV